MQESSQERDFRERDRRLASRWSRELEGASTEEILAWAARTWGSKAGIFTSFQAGGMVLIDLAQRSNLPFPIATLDTGRLPEETYEHWDRVRRRYGVEIQAVLPDPLAVGAMLRRHGPTHYRSGPEHRLECCRIRKVEPFRRAVEGLSAWLTGLRREPGTSRESTNVVEVDLANRPQGGLFKINPLADWTLDEIWSYTREHAVPTHELYERGFHSIGCEPCSRPSRPAEEPRASRWWWEAKPQRECGLHLVNERKKA